MASLGKNCKGRHSQILFIFFFSSICMCRGCFRQFHSGSNRLNCVGVLPTCSSPSHTNTAKSVVVHRMLSHRQSTCPPLPHSWDDTQERGTWWLCLAPHPAHHGPPAASNLTGHMVDPSGRCGEHLIFVLQVQMRWWQSHSAVNCRRWQSCPRLSPGPTWDTRRDTCRALDC